jgi:hypothetical protein
VHRIELERQLAEEHRDVALNEEKTTYGGLNAFVTFRTAMVKAGLSMSDLPRFVATLTAIRQSGFDPELIAAKLSNLVKAEIDSKAYGERAKFLEEQCKLLEAEKLAHSHSISIYYDLERMMLGIKELKLLRNTVREIAAANHIPEDRASQKFFQDVQTQYDYKLGFETALQNLKADIQQNQQLEVQISTMISFLNSIMLQQFDQIQRVSGLSVFGPLVKAAKGETVPANQLKHALACAIDVSLAKIDPADKSTNSLKNARILLQQGDSGDIA